MVRAALVIALVACQGSGNSEKPRTKPADAAVLIDAAELVVEDARRVEPEPEPPDPGKLIAELGAIPAWQTVIDRAQLLARRGQHGVAFGRVGPAIMQLGAAPEPVGSAKPIDAGLEASPYVWLVDDTDGN